MLERVSRVQVVSVRYRHSLVKESGFPISSGAGRNGQAFCWKEYFAGKNVLLENSFAGKGFAGKGFGQQGSRTESISYEDNAFSNIIELSTDLD